MKKLIFFLVGTWLCTTSYSQNVESYETMFLDVILPEKEELPEIILDERFDFLKTEDSVLFGIDFSHYSLVRDWNAIKYDSLNTQSHFVIMRSTMGADSIDYHYQQNLLYAKVFNFVTGSYHYFRSHQSGREQAYHYLKHVDFDCLTFLPIIDIEYKRKSISEEKMRAELLICLKVIEEVVGVKAMIYTNLNFYNKYLKGHTEFDGHPLWIAAYSEIRKDEVMSFAHMYQFTDSHIVKGIQYPVDGNIITKEKFLSLMLR